MATTRIPKEFLGAFKAGHRLAAREFIDERLPRELLRKVERGCEESKRLLLWITKFNNEYYRGVVKKGDLEAIHLQDAARKECYQRNNKQNVDLYWRPGLIKKVSGF